MSRWVLYNKNEGICSKCHATCKTCKANDEGSYLSCDNTKKGLVLNKGFCVDSNGRTPYPLEAFASQHYANRTFLQYFLL